jgi:hypothetical protein
MLVIYPVNFLIFINPAVCERAKAFPYQKVKLSLLSPGGTLAFPLQCSQ